MPNLLKKVLDWKNIQNWCNTNFSLLNHNHDNSYPSLNHNHDERYSQLNHTHDTRYVQIGQVDAIPVGTIVQSYYPLSGFLVCNGSTVSRTTYSRLFSLLGTSFGSGNGTTTFKLPSIPSGITAYTATTGICANGEWSGTQMQVLLSSTGRIRCKTTSQGSFAVYIPTQLRNCVMTCIITKLSETSVYPERIGRHNEWTIVVNGDGYTSYNLSGGSVLVSELSDNDPTADYRSWTASFTTASNNAYLGIWANEGVAWDCWVDASLVTSSGEIFDLVGLTTLSATAGYDGYSQNSNPSGAKWVSRNTLQHYIKY